MKVWVVGLVGLGLRGCRNGGGPGTALPASPPKAHIRPRDRRASRHPTVFSSGPSIEGQAAESRAPTGPRGSLGQPFVPPGGPSD